LANLNKFSCNVKLIGNATSEVRPWPAAGQARVGLHPECGAKGEGWKAKSVRRGAAGAVKMLLDIEGLMVYIYN
jgi:hypothetical protein